MRTGAESQLIVFFDAFTNVPFFSRIIREYLG